MATVEQSHADLVTLEIDGREVSAPRGAMIIEAADRIGIDIPRFCYHKKLSIAANCRMCLVDVEKAPKPLPACATPVAEGMKVFTESRRAVDAQRGVMEFLLINHPLDCPICDQGGECELQDLAMGYGRSISRFTERKRVVKDKNLGPLISTDMTRCIHCTRCVRFLEEIGGTSELGGIGRGEHTEISTFVERNIHSELSGNIIDLCPVGALTNKPFRFSARPWELRARASVAGHDCLGSHLYYHVRGRDIMRAVPREHEAINECWLADRDRYSHFGLQADDRLTVPKMRINGRWTSVSWDQAMNAAVNALQGVIKVHGGGALGVLASPRATCEEHALLKRLSQALGCANIDHRLRLQDTSHPLAGRAHMDRSLADLATADRVLLVGSHVRHDQPLLAHRLRTAWREHGCQLFDINPVAYDCHFDLAARCIVAPHVMPVALARVAAAAAALAGRGVPEHIALEGIEADAMARDIAQQLMNAKAGAVLLGDLALNHPQAGVMRALAEFIAECCEVALCALPGPANSQGAWLAGAVPDDGGLSAAGMLAQPRQAYLLMDVEPSLDIANPVQAMSALRSADKVVAISSVMGPDLAEVADIVLPLAAVPQTEGSYINLDGHRQRFSAAVAPSEQAKPGWKILRRLGEQLGLAGFDFIALEDLDHSLSMDSTPAPGAPVRWRVTSNEGMRLSRVGDVPMYNGDALVRRSRPLQDTDHARPPLLRLHPNTARALAVTEAKSVRVQQSGQAAVFDLVLDDRVAEDAAWLPSARPEVAQLAEPYGAIVIDPVAAAGSPT